MGAFGRRLVGGPLDGLPQWRPRRDGVARRYFSMLPIGALSGRNVHLYESAGHGQDWQYLGEVAWDHSMSVTVVMLCRLRPAGAASSAMLARRP